MAIIVSNESICCNLNTNTRVVMDTIVEKIWSCQFFVLYDNMNIYEHTCDQKIHNQSAFLNYNAGYICFIKMSGNMDNNNNT